MLSLGLPQPQAQIILNTWQQTLCFDAPLDYWYRYWWHLWWIHFRQDTHPWFPQLYLAYVNPTLFCITPCTPFTSRTFSSLSMQHEYRWIQRLSVVSTSVFCRIQDGGYIKRGGARMNSCFAIRQASSFLKASNLKTCLIKRTKASQLLVPRQPRHINYTLFDTVVFCYQPNPITIITTTTPNTNQIQSTNVPTKQIHVPYHDP